MNKDVEINPLIKAGVVPFDLITSNDDNIQSISQITQWIQKYIDAIFIVFFIFWGILFCEYMDRSSVYELAYLPCIGIFAACLANAVPIGGGIVYVPVLALLGSNMKVDVIFTVCTMSIGNGLFGFLKWLQKNPDIFIIDSFMYTVIPSSIGSIISFFFLPQFSIPFIRKFFGIFCLFLAVFVIAAAYRGGVDKVMSVESSSSIISSEMKLNLSNRPTQIFLFVSFLGGLILVPNIGVGPAMITFLGLSLLGYDPKRSIVTGIVTGGWVCIIPSLLHLFIFNDVPIKLWLMVLPGVYLGASIAPAVHDKVGIINVLGAFGIFLFLTSLLFLLH